MNSSEEKLLRISEQLNSQDNRMTSDPMFCIQILVREPGFDTSFTDNECWVSSEHNDVLYDKSPPKDEEGWEGPYGYKDHWLTKKVFFTKKGCEDYLAVDGHNLKSLAHDGITRIYVESYYRCDEMISIREALMKEETEPFYRDLYFELITEVATRQPEESRHSTAKRYIKECENRTLELCQKI